MLAFIGLCTVLAAAYYVLTRLVVGSYKLLASHVLGLRRVKARRGRRAEFNDSVIARRGWR